MRLYNKLKTRTTKEQSEETAIDGAGCELLFYKELMSRLYKELKISIIKIKRIYRMSKGYKQSLLSGRNSNGQIYEGELCTSVGSQTHNHLLIGIVITKKSLKNKYRQDR